MRATTKSENIQIKLGSLKEIPCSKEENKEYRQLLIEGKELPEGVFYSNPEAPVKNAKFYTLAETDIPQDVRLEYLHYKQVQALKSMKSSLLVAMQEQTKLLTIIKNCLLFFVILTILSLVGGLVGLILSI